jgi:hypothetical protein
MDEYLIIFRLDILTKEKQPTAKQMNEYMIQWNAWLESFAERNIIITGGNHLSDEGKVIMSDHRIIEKPYTETDVSVAGYITIKATDINEAVLISKNCPILHSEGNSVEVRKIQSI